MRLKFPLLLSVFLVLVAAPASLALGDTLMVAAAYDAKALDPAVMIDAPASFVSIHIHENLLRIDENSKLLPQLAESYEQLDPTTYRFVLRKGVKFHNGEELKASDVKFTMERAMSPAGSATRAYSKDLESVEVVDDYTVLLKLKQPSTPFLMLLTLSWGGIVNEKAVRAAGEKYAMEPVGTGPFRFVDWQKGDRITLERFDDYWGKKPHYKTLIFRSVPEPTSRVVELETGAVDLALEIPVNEIDRVTSGQDTKLLRTLSSSYTIMGFNCERAPFDNPEVRKAISLAVNTEGIQKAIRRGEGSVPLGPLPAFMPYFDPNLPKHEYNPEKAKAILEKLGLKNLKMALWTNEKKERVDMATIIQAQLAEIGVTVDIRVMEWGAYFQGLKEKANDAFMMGWMNNVPDPDPLCSGVFFSKVKGQTNWCFFGDDRIDELIELGRQTPDGPERGAIYKELQHRIVTDLVPCLYMDADEIRVGANKKVQGLVLYPRGYQSLAEVYFE